VNHHQARIVRADNDTVIEAKEIWDLISRVPSEFFVSSMEMLRNYGEKQGYSLAQGQ
jgi:hypothetical protein